MCSTSESCLCSPGFNDPTRPAMTDDGAHPACYLSMHSSYCYKHIISALEGNFAEPDSRISLDRSNCNPLRDKGEEKRKANMIEARFALVAVVKREDAIEPKLSDGPSSLFYFHKH